MPNTSTNYGFYEPLVNDPTDQDLWGGYLNANTVEMDTLFDVAINWGATTETSNFNVTAPTTGSSSTGSSKLLYLCNATAGAITASLPAASTCEGMAVGFKKTDSTTNNVTIACYSGDKADGANTVVLGSQYAYVMLVSDGVGWDIISQTAPAPSTPNLQFMAFNTPGSNTFTTPSNITTSTQFKFILTGAGGAGGGATFEGGAGGGGAGSTAIYIVTGLSPNTGYTITLGAGGTGVSNAQGNSGGNSTLVIGAVTVTAPGGSGGNVAGSGAGGTLGGPGGLGGGNCTNATDSIPGGGGACSGNNYGGTSGGAQGGASYWGGGAPGIVTSQNGVNATAPGSGGGGAWSNSGNVSGGNGAPGKCTVEWIA